MDADHSKGVYIYSIYIKEKQGEKLATLVCVKFSGNSSVILTKNSSSLDKVHVEGAVKLKFFFLEVA